METIKYGKDKIIDVAIKYGKNEELSVGKHELDRTTLEKRLNKTIEFLNEELIQSILEQRTKKDMGNYFYNNEMNITKAKLGRTVYDGYNYNVIDAIFLAVLICLFDQSLFKKLRNQADIKDAGNEEDAWIEAYTNTLHPFGEFWGEAGDERSWETISINIKSLFYRFTLMPNMDKYAEKLEHKLQMILKLLNQLPAQHKVSFYEDVMKSRIEYIQTNLELYIQNLKQNDSDGYYLYKLNENLAEIDKNYDK
ncbi:hypothetical protein [Virgibacillus salinus]|uniref:Uncharacterized protein n=1 Tax=Virgibacillus salinus TaxID=553311 RepID=A0A1H0XUW3_9BACI|nr:hypothetical protein [Virgibacillus salinus]SDQ06714.1 hypothetical protein SAMN05216231_0227 [Virgibacillus salinus]